MARVKHRLDTLEKFYMPVVENVTLKHKDYFDMKKFYDMMHEWVVQEGWASRTDEDFNEVFYLQRETQKSGNEIWIWWRLEKVPHGSSYIKYEMDLDLHVILLKEVEVVRNNVKYKAHHGEPEVKLHARVVLDYQKKWRNHWLLKHFHDLFIKRWYKGTIYVHRRHVYREVYRFQEFIKTYFKLKTYLPEEEQKRYYLNKDMEE